VRSESAKTREPSFGWVNGTGATKKGTIKGDSLREGKKRAIRFLYRGFGESWFKAIEKKE